MCEVQVGYLDELFTSKQAADLLTELSLRDSVAELAELLMPNDGSLAIHNETAGCSNGAELSYLHKFFLARFAGVQCQRKVGTKLVDVDFSHFLSELLDKAIHSSLFRVKRDTNGLDAEVVVDV